MALRHLMVLTHFTQVVIGELYDNIFAMIVGVFIGGINGW